MQDVRERLEQERRRALARLGSVSGELDQVVAASVDTNADDEHDPEGATIAFERSQISSVVRLARAHVAEVDAAIERLEAGSYGTCEGCRRPIAAARLEARPVARTCIDCAS